MSDQEAPRTDGQRIADELADIKELLSVIASSLFEIAGGQDTPDDDDRSGGTYLDGSPKD